MPLLPTVYHPIGQLAFKENTRRLPLPTSAQLKEGSPAPPEDGRSCATGGLAADLLSLDEVQLTYPACAIYLDLDAA